MLLLTTGVHSYRASRHLLKLLQKPLILRVMRMTIKHISLCLQKPYRLYQIAIRLDPYEIVGQETYYSSEFLSYLNTKRVEQELGELSWDDSIVGVAYQRSQEIVENYGHDTSGRIGYSEIIQISGTGDVGAWYEAWCGDRGHQWVMYNAGITKAGVSCTKVTYAYGGYSSSLHTSGYFYRHFYYCVIAEQDLRKCTMCVPCFAGVRERYFVENFLAILS